MFSSAPCSQTPSAYVPLCERSGFTPVQKDRILTQIKIHKTKPRFHCSEIKKCVPCKTASPFRCLLSWTLSPVLVVNHPRLAAANVRCWISLSLGDDTWKQTPVRIKLCPFIPITEYVNKTNACVLCVLLSQHWRFSRTARHRTNTLIFKTSDTCLLAQWWVCVHTVRAGQLSHKRCSSCAWTGDF
jgi:hypothetical protein